MLTTVTSVVLPLLEQREDFPLATRGIVGEQSLRFEAARRHHAAGHLNEARRYFESFDIS